jgi:hypothetical protein
MPVHADGQKDQLEVAAQPKLAIRQDAPGGWTVHTTTGHRSTSFAARSYILDDCGDISGSRGRHYVATSSRCGSHRCTRERD